MNKPIRSQKAFTLVEVLIVLVIVGVLVKIALPSMFAQVQRQQAQEAMNTMAMMRSAMEACGIQNNYDFSGCDSWSNLTMTDPSSSKFTYTWRDQSGANAPANGTYYMTAKSTGNANDWMRMYRDSSGMTCLANGIFQGMC